ncbi:chaperonin 10-like protein [Aspergillus unguis]
MLFQKSIIQQGPKKAALVTDRPIPRLRPGYVLVRVRAVGLNPADWKHIEFADTPGCLLGYDYAGEVVEVGSGYSKAWKVGDRLCGLVHGGNCFEKEDGAFAEMIVVRADVQLSIPDHMSFEAAATLGTGVVTAGQGLYQGMGLTLPAESLTTKEFILIYGGSTTIGTYGIQFAKLSGYIPITTCSPRNFEFVKSIGAVAAFDYNDPECAAQIKEYTNNTLKLVWDAVTLESSINICIDVISPRGKYGKVLATEIPRTDITISDSVGLTALGEPIDKGFFKAADTSHDFEFMKKLVAIVDKLLAEGKIVAHPPQVDYGMDKVFEGLDLLKNNKVSGHKLVYVL